MRSVRSGRDGYTIVETLIFLAVSGGLFLSAMLVVNGQQRKTEFSTAIRDLDSKLQSVMGNVASGYYNNAGTVSCENVGGAPQPSNVASEQGQNGDCTFIGQYIALVEPQNESFTITSYAGLRINPATGEEVQNLTQAVPTPITSTEETYELLNGLTVLMRIREGNPINRLGITTTFSQQGEDGLVSGHSRTETHAFTGAGTDTINPTEGVYICLTNGEQVGAILLNNGSTNVTIIDQVSVTNPNPCVP